METEKTTIQTAANHSAIEHTPARYQKGDHVCLIEGITPGTEYGHLELYPPMLFSGTKKIKYAGKNSVELEGTNWVYSYEMIEPAMPSTLKEIEYFVLSALNDRNGGEICLSL